MVYGWGQKEQVEISEDRINSEKCLNELRGGKPKDELFGKEIYEYKVSDEAYEEAKLFLQKNEVGLAFKGKKPERLSASLRIIFLIYCAEKYRRENISTFEKWEPLVEGLSFKSNEIDAHEIVRLALGDIGLAVFLSKNKRSRECLHTIAITAGFPVKLLGRDDKWVKNFLSNSLEEVFINETFDENKAKLIYQKHCHRIPDSWECEQLRKLSIALFTSLFKIWNNIPADLRDTGSITEFLENSRPNWHKSLPLTIDSENAKKFFDIVDESAKSANKSRKPKNPFRAYRALVLQSGQFIEALHCELPDEIELDEGFEANEWVDLKMGSALIARARPVTHKSNLRKVDKKASYIPCSSREEICLKWVGSEFEKEVSEISNSKFLDGKILAFRKSISDSRIFEFDKKNNIQTSANKILIIAPTDSEYIPAEGMIFKCAHSDIASIFEVNASGKLITPGLDEEFQILLGVDDIQYEIRATPLPYKNWAFKKYGLECGSFPIFAYENEVHLPNAKIENTFKYVGHDIGECKSELILEDGRKISKKTIILPHEFEISTKAVGKKLEVVSNYGTLKVTIDDQDLNSRNEFKGKIKSKISAKIGLLKQEYEIYIPIEIKDNAIVDKYGNQCEDKEIFLHEIDEYEVLSKTDNEIMKFELLSEKNPCVTYIKVESRQFKLSELKEAINRLFASTYNNYDKIIISFKGEAQNRIVIRHLKDKLKFGAGGALVSKNVSNSVNSPFARLQSLKPNIEVSQEEEIHFMPMKIFEKGFCINKNLEVNGINTGAQKEGKSVFKPNRPIGHSFAYMKRGNEIISVPSAFKDTANNWNLTQIESLFFNFEHHVFREWSAENFDFVLAKQFVKILCNIGTNAAKHFMYFSMASEKLLVRALFLASEDEEKLAKVFALQDVLPFMWFLIPQLIWLQEFAEYKKFLSSECTREEFVGQMLDESIENISRHDATLRSIIKCEVSYEASLETQLEKFTSLVLKKSQPIFEACPNFRTSSSSKVPSNIDAVFASKLEELTLNTGYKYRDGWIIAPLRAYAIIKGYSRNQKGDLFNIWRSRYEYKHAFDDLLISLIIADKNLTGQDNGKI